MIIFYNKKTGKVFSVTLGRLHPQEVIDKSWVQPSDIAKEDIGKYVVPYVEKQIYVEEPVKEFRVTESKTGRVEEIVVGKKKVLKTIDFVPDVQFSHILELVEKNEANILDYRITNNEKGINLEK